MSDRDARQLFARNINHLLEERQETQRDIARLLDVAPSTVSSWFSGVKVPRMERLDALAAHFGVTSAQLLADSGEIPPGCQPNPEMVWLPRVGRIACGTPITAEENIEGQDPVPCHWHGDFTLICKGDSMSPRILNGDLVAIRRQPQVENGEIAAVRIGEEATLKHVYYYPNYIELRPENAAFASIIKIGAEMNEVIIEGKAVGLCRDL